MIYYKKGNDILPLPGDEGTTGILAETLPEDSFGYADLIRSGKYTLIRPE